MAPSAMPATRNEVAQPHRERLRTIADGYGRESGVERTRPNPQITKIEREPFAGFATP